MLQDRMTPLAESAHKSDVTLPGGEVGAVRVGAELRAARERLGWALPDVSAGLRIRLPYLVALEAGRLEDLPGRAYAVGFLRTYAAAMGLEAADLARRMKVEVATVHRKTELTFPAPVSERGLPTGAIVLVGVVLAIVAYASWYRLSGDGRLPAEAVLAVPERLAPLAQQAVPPSASLLTVPPTQAPVVAGTVPVPADRSPGFPPNSAAAMPLPPMPAAIVPPAAGVTEAIKPSIAALTSGPASQIVLRAKVETWMQVREKGGRVLFNKVLQPGETWTVPQATTPLLLTTGNAAGTELLLGGTLAPPLASKAAVQRDLPLEADTIRAGKLVPPPPTPTAAVPVTTGPSTPASH